MNDILKRYWQIVLDQKLEPIDSGDSLHIAYDEYIIEGHSIKFLFVIGSETVNYPDWIMIDGELID